MHTRILLAAFVGFLSFAGPVHAASAPVAVTGAVTTFSDTSAAVTGNVNPNGQATTWHFDYGTNTSYGSTTPATSAGSGTTGTGVSATITGLVPGTTYHYRLAGTNATGTTNGTSSTARARATAATRLRRTRARARARRTSRRRSPA